MTITINGTTGLTLPTSSGIVSAPSGTALQLQSNGTTNATLDTAGNLGLGVTPSAWGSLFRAFQFGPNGGSINARTDSNQAIEFALNWYYDGSTTRYINSNFATRYRQFSGAHEWYTAPSGTAGNAISFTQAMTLDASGNLLVGGTSTGALDGVFGIVVGGSGKSTGGVAIESSTSQWMTYTDSSQAMLFYDSRLNTERARIDSSGNLLVGTTSASGSSGNGIKLNPNEGGSGIPTQYWIGNTTSSGSYWGMVRSTSNNTWRFYGDYAGNLYAVNTSIISLSDARLKENVRDLDTGLETVLALKPRRFDWKEGQGQDKKNVAGFIAQEVEPVLPEIVTTGMDEDANGDKYKMLAPGMLIPTLVKAIQEQQAIIQTLTARIEALEGAKS